MYSTTAAATRLKIFQQRLLSEAAVLEDAALGWESLDMPVAETLLHQGSQQVEGQSGGSDQQCLARKERAIEGGPLDNDTVAHQESRETNRLRNRHAIRRLDLANVADCDY